MNKVVVPLEEKSVMHWSIEAAYLVRQALGVDQRLMDDTVLFQQGMMFACKNPELAWAMLQCLHPDAREGYERMVKHLTEPFQFETPKATP